MRCCALRCVARRGGYPLPADSRPAEKEGECGGSEVDGGGVGVEVTGGEEDTGVRSLPLVVAGGDVEVGVPLPAALVAGAVVTGGLMGGWEVRGAELVAVGVGVGSTGGGVGLVAGSGR